MSHDPHVAAIVDLIRTVARRYGWAIGTHGSLVRDIDLIATPWTPYAESWTDLLAALCAATRYIDAGGRGAKPHGRVAVTLLAPGATVGKDPDANAKARWWPPAIDLSIVDPRPPPPARA